MLATAKRCPEAERYEREGLNDRFKLTVSLTLGEPLGGLLFSGHQLVGAESAVDQSVHERVGDVLSAQARLLSSRHVDGL
jgi:hypothetical protein